MQQVAIAPDQVQDPFERNVPGIGVGRDGCRTPMQWDATANAGFSRAKPWLPLARDFAQENVRNLEADGTSILSFYKALISLRQQTPELIGGAYEPVIAENDLLIYRRRLTVASVLVVLNLGDAPMAVVSSAISQDGTILLSTFMDRTGEMLSDSLELRGNEGVIVRPPTLPRR
jgi:alpha-glucosidase